MIKKYCALLFVSVAYAILLGHNIIPHHHHDNATELAQHHHTHYDHEEDGGDLGHMLSDLMHPDDGFTVTLNHNISNTFSKQQLSFAAVLPGSFFFNEFLVPPLLYKPPAEHFVYNSPHSLSSGLRAPPAFIG